MFGDIGNTFQWGYSSPGGKEDALEIDYDELYF